AALALPYFPKGLPRSLPSLIRSFERARPEARPAYTLVVERIRPGASGEDVVRALGSALSSPDDEVRCLAASALRAFREAAHAGIPALVPSIARPSRDRKTTPVPADHQMLIDTPDVETWWTRGPGSTERKEPALTAALTLLRVLPTWPDLETAPTIDPKS